MGYTLEIGEAVLEYDEERVQVGCKGFSHDEAPAYGEPTDHLSQRWPSYSAWADTMRQLGMVDVMFNHRNGGKGEFEWNGISREPLMPTHPGAAPITKEHVEFIEHRLAEYKAKHPTHIAHLPPLKPGAVPMMPGSSFYLDDQYVDDERYDVWLCRGEWLAYWVRWAIENCERPVFVNS